MGAINFHLNVSMCLKEISKINSDISIIKKHFIDMLKC